MRNSTDVVHNTQFPVDSIFISQPQIKCGHEARRPSQNFDPCFWIPRPLLRLPGLGDQRARRPYPWGAADPSYSAGVFPYLLPLQSLQPCPRVAGNHRTAGAGGMKGSRGFMSIYPLVDQMWHSLLIRVGDGMVSVGPKWPNGFWAFEDGIPNLPADIFCVKKSLRGAMGSTPLPPPSSYLFERFPRYPEPTPSPEYRLGVSPRFLPPSPHLSWALAAHGKLTSRGGGLPL